MNIFTRTKNIVRNGDKSKKSSDKTVGLGPSMEEEYKSKTLPKPPKLVLMNRNHSDSSSSSNPNNSSNSFESVNQSLNSVEDVPSSPLSTQKSNKLKFAPSSLVRNSMIYDDPTLGNSQESTLGTNFASNLGNVIGNSTKYPELNPIITLINCHNMRTYIQGKFHIQIDSDQWLEVESKLTGNELSIWSVNEYTPKYFNLFDYNITYDVDNLLIKFSNDLNESFYNLIIRLESTTEFLQWLTGFKLSNYEKISLYEGFTAVILSVFGPNLSDIHTLLSRKKYPKSDWFNIRLPQINHKWLKVFIVINPSTSKKLGNIQIYQSEKLTKKNLIGYISGLTNVYNIFPESLNMVEVNSIMKLNGEVWINKNFQHLFQDPSVTNTPELTQNSSFASTNSLTPPVTGTTHKRTTSQSSFFSISSSPPTSPKIKSSSRFIRTNYIYLMPNNHPGVKEIETMLRNIIPIMDCFKLYGRPTQLVSDKLNPISLLFGLPSLPQYQYLTMTDAASVTKSVLEVSGPVDMTDFNKGDRWSRETKSLIGQKLKDGYKGEGNVGYLFKSLELESSDLQSLKSLPSLRFPNEPSSPIPSTIMPNDSALNTPKSPGSPLSPGHSRYNSINFDFDSPSPVNTSAATAAPATATATDTPPLSNTPVQHPYHNLGHIHTPNYGQSHSIGLGLNGRAKSNSLSRSLNSPSFKNDNSENYDRIDRVDSQVSHYDD